MCITVRLGLIVQTGYLQLISVVSNQPIAIKMADKPCLSIGDWKEGEWRKCIWTT